LRILHIGLHVRTPPGVANQLGFEKSAAARLDAGVRWETRSFSLEDGDPDTPPTPGPGRWLPAGLDAYLRLRRHAFGWLRNHRRDYDAILLRYSLGDPLQWWNSGWFDNVFTVHHTLEVPEARHDGGVRGQVKATIEQTLGRSVLGRVRGIIGVTDEIVRYETERISRTKPGYCYPNGIDLSTQPVVGDERTGPPRLLIVASSFVSWHGLDRVLDSLAGTTRPFELHIVGDVGPTELRRISADPRFVAHGLRDTAYLNGLMATSDIGLSSFALERKGMAEACTLKVREYLAAGLPVFAGHRDSGLPADFPFYKQGEPQSDAMLDYAVDCRRIERSEVRNAAARFIDKQVLMSGLAEWLATHAAR